MHLALDQILLGSNYLLEFLFVNLRVLLPSFLLIGIDLFLGPNFGIFFDAIFKVVNRKESESTGKHIVCAKESAAAGMIVSRIINERFELIQVEVGIIERLLGARSYQAFTLFASPDPPPKVFIVYRDHSHL